MSISKWMVPWRCSWWSSWRWSVEWVPVESDETATLGGRPGSAHGPEAARPPMRRQPRPSDAPEQMRRNWRCAAAPSGAWSTAPSSQDCSLEKG